VSVSRPASGSRPDAVLDVLVPAGGVRRGSQVAVAQRLDPRADFRVVFPLPRPQVVADGTAAEGNAELDGAVTVPGPGDEQRGIAELHLAAAAGRRPGHVHIDTDAGVEDPQQLQDAVAGADPRGLQEQLHLLVVAGDRLLLLAAALLLDADGHGRLLR